MQTQPTELTRHFAGSDTLPSGVTPPGAWQAWAISVYQQSDPAATLRAELAAAVHALTGRLVDERSVVVDQEQRAALASVDDVRFQWAEAQLTVIRPCAHCGLGALASPPIQHVQALGYALSDWQPLHDDCRPFDPDEMM